MALREVLQNRPHEFEFALGGFVFDLALFDTKVLVEFDGPYHLHSDQAEVDAQKDQAAINAGFLIVRRTVEPAVVINPSTLSDL